MATHWPGMCIQTLAVQEAGLAHVLIPVVEWLRHLPKNLQTCDLGSYPQEEALTCTSLTAQSSALVTCDPSQTLIEAFSSAPFEVQ